VTARCSETDDTQVEAKQKTISANSHSVVVHERFLREFIAEKYLPFVAFQVFSSPAAD
jgi:hypothetical protein